jgi:hypothetical protein
LRFAAVEVFPRPAAFRASRLGDETHRPAAIR